MGFGVVIVNDYNDQVEARMSVPDQRTWQTNMHRSYCVLNYCHDTDYSRNLRCSTCFVGWMLFFSQLLLVTSLISLDTCQKCQNQEWWCMSHVTSPTYCVSRQKKPFAANYEHVQNGPLTQLISSNLSPAKSQKFFSGQSPLLTDLVYMYNVWLWLT